MNAYLQMARHFSDFELCNVCEDTDNPAVAELVRRFKAKEETERSLEEAEDAEEEAHELRAAIERALTLHGEGDTDGAIEALKDAIA